MIPALVVSTMTPKRREGSSLATWREVFFEVFVVQKSCAKRER